MPAQPPIRRDRRDIRTPVEEVGLQQALAALDEGQTIDEFELAAIVETAVLSTYRRAVAEDDGVLVRAHLATNAFELYRYDGDGVEQPVEVRVPDFTRQVAQETKRVVALRLREAQRERVVKDADSRRGELLNSIVERQDGPRWWLRVDNYPAVLPPEEQMAGEQLQRNQHLKVVVIDVQRRNRDAVVIVSRSHPQLLRALLAQEVPELASGQITIKAIAREAGRRSKVAVWAEDDNLDAQGACIGPRGVRHRAVVSELSDEQVQIIQWSDDPAVFIANALTPAKVDSVVLDPDGRTAHCVVPADQLSLAIGRSGENARLTARITGWRIDITARPTDGAEGEPPL